MEGQTWTVSCVPSAPSKWLHLLYQLQSWSSGLNETKRQRAHSRQRWMQPVVLVSVHAPMEPAAQSASFGVTPQWPREVRITDMPTETHVRSILAREEKG